MNTRLRHIVHLFFRDFYIKGEMFVEGPIATWLGQRANGEIRIYHCTAIPFGKDNRISAFEQQSMVVQLRAVQAIGVENSPTIALATLVTPTPMVVYLDHLLLKGLFQVYRGNGKQSLFADSPFATAMRCFLLPTLPLTKEQLPRSFPLLFVRREYVRFYYPLEKS